MDGEGAIRDSDGRRRYKGRGGVEGGMWVQMHGPRAIGKMLRVGGKERER